ncbi:MAG: hypothetical protein Q4E74_01630, partial [Ruminococcus sp.]|nr:hypothetical protein [Ruminococcus sp.]
MKISKIFAGMSALAMAATMAMTASAATTISVDGPETNFNSAFPNYTNAEGEEVGDFIDANSLTAGTALDVTVNFEWTSVGTDSGYILIAPCHAASGWSSLFKEGNLENVASKDASTQDEETGKWTDPDGNVVDYVVQPDGFIVCGIQECNSISFTVSSAGVDSMIEAAKAENGYDGLVFNAYGVKVTSVEVSQDNVKMNSEMQTGGDESSNTDTSSTGDTSSSKA